MKLTLISLFLIVAIFAMLLWLGIAVQQLLVESPFLTAGLRNGYFMRGLFGIHAAPDEECGYHEAGYGLGCIIGFLLAVVTAIGFTAVLGGLICMLSCPGERPDPNNFRIPDEYREILFGKRSLW